MRLFKKHMLMFSINILVFLGLVSTISGTNNSYIDGEASSGVVTITIPNAASDGTSSFNNTTIFTDAVVGLNQISPSQTIISSALVTNSVFAGVSGYLLGTTSSTGGSFAFKTSQYITSISATFTKFSTELATVFIRSGGSAKASAAAGEIGINQTFSAEENTLTLTWAPVASYYFNVGTNTATTSTNNAYLTSISFTYNNSMKQSLYKSYNFSDGGNSSNNNYATQNIATLVTYENNDPVSGPTTNWEVDYANLSLIYGTRLGSGNTTSTSSIEQTDDTTAWANIKTLFSFDKPIHLIQIMSLVVNSDSSLFDRFILQYSPEVVENRTWTTIQVKDDAEIEKGILTFSGFTIPANSRIRFGMTWIGSSSNIQASFTGIEIYSYDQCL